MPTGVAVHVACGDDRALVVGEQAAPVAADRVVVPDERIVRAVGVDVALHHRAGAVILADQLVAVVEELGRPRAAAGCLPQPPVRVVSQRQPARTRHQSVLRVVDIAARAVRREIAVRVISVSVRADGRNWLRPLTLYGRLTS